MLEMIREKLKTGIPGLDEMLEGGLIPGRPYVVSGASGTGKTTLAIRFLLEGANHGERVLYVALDEPPNETKRNISAFGWDLSNIVLLDATLDIMSYDKTPVRDVSTERKMMLMKEIGEGIRKTPEKGPADMTVNTLQEMLKQEMRVRKYTRVVIDSVTSMKHFYIRTSEEYATVQSFFRLMSDLGVTTILTVQTPEVSKPDAESHMSRGEIKLHKWFDGKGMQRGVTIEKYRGSAHDQRMRPFKITSDGIDFRASVTHKKDAKQVGAAEGEGAKQAPAQVADTVPHPAVQPGPAPAPDAKEVHAPREVPPDKAPAKPAEEPKGQTGQCSPGGAGIQ